MEFRGVIFILFLFLVIGVDSNAFPMNDLIRKLPRQPDVNFSQFAGYIEEDRNVDVEKDHLTQPLPIWLTGGPGCSSVEDAFGSIGLFIVTKDAHVSNLLFIDSPIGSECIIKTTWSAKCKNLVFEADLAAFKTDAHNYSPQKLFDVFRPPCAENELNLNLRKQHEVDMCLPLRVQFYFNIPEVQKAFHGNRTNLSYRWQGCFTANVKYNKADKDHDMLPALKNLLQQSVPITIFSGDQDGIIPTEGTLQHLEKLAEELNIKLTKEETWRRLKYEFGDLLKFLMVKGGNHHVTSSRPSHAFFIFSNFAIKYWIH
ncbi:hypothetical protein V6Z11_A05G353300 [Gossypium hirsutum]